MKKEGFLFCFVKPPVYMRMGGQLTSVSCLPRFGGGGVIVILPRGGTLSVSVSARSFNQHCTRQKENNGGLPNERYGRHHADCSAQGPEARRVLRGRVREGEIPRHHMPGVIAVVAFFFS